MTGDGNIGFFHSLASHEIVVAFHQCLVCPFHHGDDRDDPGADDHDDHMIYDMIYDDDRPNVTSALGIQRDS